MRGLEQIRNEHTEVHTFFPALLHGLKQVAMEVHTVFFITNSDSSLPALEPYKELKQESENMATRNVSNPPKPSRALKREATAPLIQTQNKFAVLATLSNWDGAVATSPAYSLSDDGNKRKQ